MLLKTNKSVPPKHSLLEWDWSVQLWQCALYYVIHQIGGQVPLQAVKEVLIFVRMSITLVQLAVISHNVCRDRSLNFEHGTSLHTLSELRCQILHKIWNVQLNF